MLLVLPANTGQAAPKLLFAERVTLDDPTVDSNDLVPLVAIIGAVCVILPAAITVKFCPILLLPKLKEVLLVMLTLLLPVVVNATAPLKVLFWVKVIGLTPAVKLEVPGGKAE